MDINISLIDYIGKIEDGIAVLLSLSLNDKLYEIIYWFNEQNKFTINFDKNFYKDYPNIKNIYEYEYLLDLIYYIDTNVLPPRKDIFEHFK